MTTNDKELPKIEAFVRNVLGKNFDQKLDPDTLRAVAKKIQVSAFANIRRNPQTARDSSPNQKPC